MSRIADRKRWDFLSYRGPLSIPEIAKGMEACVRNARAQYESGKLLLSEGRWGSAISAFLVAQQEAGKVWILRRMALLEETDDAKWKACWRDFRHHSAKNLSTQQMMVGLEYPPEGGSVFWSLLEFDRDRSETLEQARQAALYVDFIEVDRDWWTPDDLTSEVAELAEGRTTKLLNHLIAEHEVGILSCRALEVYREEFSGWEPGIEVDKEYPAEDFDERVIGLRGPYKRFLRRLFHEDVIDLGNHELLILGKPVLEFLAEGEGREE